MEYGVQSIIMVAEIAATLQLLLIEAGATNGLVKANFWLVIAI
jgi:hypothetical protein